MSHACYKIPQVIFFGECEVTLTTTPHKVNLFEELKEVRNKVVIDDVTVDFDKTLIDGTLKTNVQFKRADKLVGDIDISTPFACCLDTPGSRFDDRFQIEFAFVAVQRDFVGIPPRDLSPVEDIDKFWEKVCIRIGIKILRDVQVTLEAVEPNICPQPFDNVQNAQASGRK